MEDQIDGGFNQTDGGFNQTDGGPNWSEDQTDRRIKLMETSYLK